LYHIPPTVGILKLQKLKINLTTRALPAVDSGPRPRRNAGHDSLFCLVSLLFRSHPINNLFSSLPGAGPKLAPRLLAEIGDDLEPFEGEARNLHCFTGTAPVTERSGKHRECHPLWACNKYLRYALHLFTEKTIRAVSGPRPIAKPTALKTTPMPDRYVA
jgi:transposase